MNQTLEALDTFLAWYISEIHGFMKYDFEVFSNNHWMSWTVIPAFLYGLFMVFKYHLLWGVITVPIASIYAGLGKLIIGRIIKSAKKKKA